MFESCGALLTVIADGLHGATFHGLSAESNLLIGHGLLAYVGKTLVIIAGKEISGGLAAQIAVNAVAVNIELAGNILLSLIVDIGHCRVYGGLYPQPFMTYFSRNATLFYCNIAFFGTK